TDLRLAGQGSTGAIAVPTTGILNVLAAGFATNSPGAVNALPAVSGADNIVGKTTTSGAVTPAWPTDAIMMVVPDPTTIAQLSQNAAAGATALVTWTNVNGGAACPTSNGAGVGIYYVADHSSSLGAGRTHLLRGTATVNGVNLTSGDVPVFNISAGADVM